MHNLVEFEFPRLLLVVNMATAGILGDVNRHMLYRDINYYLEILTELIGSILMFFEAKFGVGLVLMTTFTDCFGIVI